jgi:hypothetical protein
LSGPCPALSGYRSVRTQRVRPDRTLGTPALPVEEYPVLCCGPCRHLPDDLVLDPLPDIGIPHIDLSNIDLPNIALPNIALPDIDFRRHTGDRRRPGAGPMPAATANAMLAGIVACPVRGRAVAAAYAALPDWDDAALPAYRAFRDETARQFELLTRGRARGGCGIDVAVSATDPYPDAPTMAASLAATGVLRVLATGGANGSHPFMSGADNTMFRAVHDVFGHLASRRGFDRHGEEAAWFAHGLRYSPLARLAMTTETRGQSSAFIWLHRGRFPEQKLALLPYRFCDPGQVSVRVGALDSPVVRTAGLSRPLGRSRFRSGRIGGFGQRIDPGRAGRA